MIGFLKVFCNIYLTLSWPGFMGRICYKSAASQNEQISKYVVGHTVQ
jgi:hypothetical protein